MSDWGRGLRQSGDEGKKRGGIKTIGMLVSREAFSCQRLVSSSAVLP